ncbi:hypothetical protein ACQ1Y8_13980, partial [Enterococcus faecalis]|uniref:hypothetical protein n=1 Tax=Enterococcus faecalis TaxID=1351 RepID=UPI003D6B8793
AHLNESSNFYINWLSPTELELQCAECKEIVPLQPDTEIDGRKIKIHILENIKDWQKLSPGFLLEERYAKSLGKSNIKNASFDRKFPEQATKAFA